MVFLDCKNKTAQEIERIAKNRGIPLADGLQKFELVVDGSIKSFRLYRIDVDDYGRKANHELVLHLDCGSVGSIYEVVNGLVYDRDGHYIGKFHATRKAHAIEQVVIIELTHYLY